MQRIKRLFLFIHIILWMLFAFVISLQTSQDTDQWRRLTAAVMVTSMFVFYCHFTLLTRYAGRKKDSNYFMLLVAIIFTAPLIYIAIHYRKLDTFDLFSEYYLISLISVVIPFVCLGWLARTTETLVINTFKKEQLENQAVEAELYYLRSQINPHFLFNTLNNIHALVYKQASTAPDAVMQLASLMRYMIYESNATTVPVTREIQYLKDYISLQQLRYKPDPVVDLEIEGGTSSIHIAPLLFIHLLENAYKHSPARLEPGDLKVRLSVKEEVLTFSIQNPVNTKLPSSLDEPGGVGLPNVKKRLGLLYPGRHSIEIQKTEQTFTVILKIQGLQLQPDATEAHLLYN